MRQGNNSRRSRGRGNGKRQPRGNHVDSHGPEVRVRGTAQQVYDKYLALARDASSSGDRISAENMYQHAEHYFRALTIAQENSEQRNDNRDGSRSRRGRSGNDEPREVSHEGDDSKANENTEALTTDNKATDLGIDVDVKLENPVVADNLVEENLDAAKPDDPSSQAGDESKEQTEQVTL